MNFDKDYKEFLEWEITKGGTCGPIEFTTEEDVSIRLFVAYLNCRYANTRLTPAAPDSEGRCSCKIVIPKNKTGTIDRTGCPVHRYK